MNDPTSPGAPTERREPGFDTALPASDQPADGGPDLASAGLARPPDGTEAGRTADAAGTAGTPPDAPSKPSSPRRFAHRALQVLGLISAAVLAAAGIAVLLVWSALRPSEGDWQERVTWHGLAMRVNMPALLRLATHPLVVPLLDGHSTDTALGQWRWSQVPADAAGAALASGTAGTGIDTPQGASTTAIHPSRTTYAAAAALGVSVSVLAEASAGAAGGPIAPAAVDTPAAVSIANAPRDAGVMATAATPRATPAEPPPILTGRCAPCRIRMAALGVEPLVVDEARIAIQRAGSQWLRGTLWLGVGDAVALRWQAEIGARDATLSLELPRTAAREVLHAFAASVPEAATARIDGSVALAARGRWGPGLGPRGTWTLAPHVDDLAVSGLGTEALAGAELPARCRVAGAGPIEGWLPRAVVAAEDQRFWEHPGYDLTQWRAAWQHNQAQGLRAAQGAPGMAPAPTPQGASTITQQLAKLVVAGDTRSPARKLRELLYAVEMESTLGKGRILQLYLALAPWGEGVCGAAQAAQAHLGRDAGRLGPVASAWLASLLTAPDAQLRAQRAGAAPDPARIEHILRGMRPMSRASRQLALEQMVAWRPPLTGQGLASADRVLRLAAPGAAPVSATGAASRPLPQVAPQAQAQAEAPPAVAPAPPAVSTAHEAPAAEAMPPAPGTPSPPDTAGAATPLHAPSPATTGAGVEPAEPAPVPVLASLGDGEELIDEASAPAAVTDRASPLPPDEPMPTGRGAGAD